jgi:hypothetical protein
MREAPASLELGPTAGSLAQAKERYGSRAIACWSCGSSPELLTWVRFVSPAWTWKALCGCAGWLTICERCHLQVDFLLESFN